MPKITQLISSRTGNKSSGQPGTKAQGISFYRLCKELGEKRTCERALARRGDHLLAQYDFEALQTSAGLVEHSQCVGWLGWGPTLESQVYCCMYVTTFFVYKGD